MNYVVVPVHGTWGKKAAWMESSSRFRTDLKDLLGEPTVRPFRWSGGNSVRARARAAEELHEHLQALVAEFPDARLAVVAHSHGGNVALHALRDEVLARKVFGVACLGTPFLNVRERTLSARPMAQLRLGAKAAVFLLIWICLLLVMGNVGVRTMVGPAIWSKVVLPFSIGPAWALTVALVAVLWSKTKSLAEQVRLASQLPASIRFQLLILCTEGDEASGVLGFTQAGGWLITATWQRWGNCFGQFRERWRAMLEKERLGQQWLRVRHKDSGPTLFGFGSVVVSTVLLAMAIGPLHLHGSSWLALLAFCPMLLLWLPEVLQAVLGAMALPPFVVGSLCYWGFGIAVVCSALHLDVSATPTPLGDWVVCQLGSLDSAAEPGDKESSANLSMGVRATDGGVAHTTYSSAPSRHSMLHENPAAISRVCRWLSGDTLASEHVAPD